jgi:hypothetical protein
MLLPSGCCIGIQGRTNKFPSGRRWRDQYQIGPNEQLMRSGHDLNRSAHRDQRHKLVCSLENLFSTLYRGHVENAAHSGSEKLYKLVGTKYDASITIQVCRAFCKLCPKCHGGTASKKKPVAGANPIRTSGFNERQQVDLIDLRSAADGPYNWLLVYQDHGLKFCTLRPLPDKSMMSVMYALYCIWTEIGAPVIIQADNGKEFARVSEALLEHAV